jgi:hypothetical protein
MKKALAAVAIGALSLAASSPASAAEISISPQKPCYRSGEELDMTGSGFTPNGSVTVSFPGTILGEALTDATGAFAGTLTLRKDNGRERRTYTATDSVDPALTASTEILISEVDVVLKPRNGAPGRPLRIDADGFTTGRRLWAHVNPPGRGRVRNLKIGRLKGACHSLLVKRALLPRNAKVGLYVVQFDTFRRYRSKRPAKVGYTIRVQRVFRPSAAAASVSWNRIF